MLKGNLRYFLFSLANLIAAFGGGLILGRGIGVIKLKYLQGGAVLAFFIGTILGLIFLQIIPKKWSNFFAKNFSFACALTSLILFYIFENYSFNNFLDGSVAFVFFLFLSIRFGFWFYSRVIRASTTVNSEHSIAWVEMGYYLGMVLGLIIWKLLNFDLALGSALILDACLQFIAGLLDFKSKIAISASTHEPKHPLKNPSIKTAVLGKIQWCWRLSGAVIFLTLAIQVILFSVAHYTSQLVSAYIIAIFYFGVASGAFFCSTWKIRIAWDNTNSLAYVYSNSNKLKLKLSYLLLLSFFSVILVVNSIQLTPSSLNLVYFFVFVAAFVFEVISVALLDRIGFEEKQLKSSNMIMKTYGLMGLSAAIGFWLLSFLGNIVQNCMIILLSCLIFFSSFITKRNLIKDSST